MLRNSPQAYGWIAVVLHWSMAVVIFGLFGLGFYMVELTYYDALYRTLPSIHKSVGILLALVLVLRISWRWSNPVPEAVAGSKPVERRIAALLHRLFYLLIAVIMFSGYLISTADSSSISVFGWFSVPASITGIPQQEDIAGLVHQYLAYTLIALVVLHSAAALKHHFIDRDVTLRRILGYHQDSRS